MFKISTDPKFTHPVTVCVPVDGGHEEMTFKATFRVVPLEQLSETSGNEAQTESLRKIIVRLDDLVDDNEQPVSYSDTLRDKLIALPFMRLALMRSYLEAVTKTKAGN